MVAQLRPDDIRRLAALYRQSRDVADALDSVPLHSVAALSSLNQQLRDGIAVAGRGEVGPLDLEDATMAAWLALVASTDDRPAVTSLRWPWRHVTRTVSERTSRTQADRVTFRTASA